MMKSCKYGILTVLMLLLLFPLSVRAAGDIDMDAPVSLTVTAHYGEAPIEGMKFYAYQISTMEKNGELTVRDLYEKEKDALDIRGKNDSAWAKLAQELERKLLLEQKIMPDAAAVTDAKGAAVFTGLSKGLYLIRAEGVEKSGYAYTASAFFVMLPEQDKKENAWNYEITANAKTEQSTVLGDYQVVKRWEDDCHKSRRPKSIEVTLYCDGKAYETITLPENGRWEHTWKNLSVSHYWTVDEKQQNGYNIPQISRKGNVFTITNTCSQPAEQGAKLPQTGPLWWPVPVLLAAGLFLIVLGLIRRKGSFHEK